MEKRFVYADNAATTKPDPRVLEAMKPYLTECWGNPSSIHTAGKEARGLLEEARKNCAKTLSVPAETIYFTSGGTESDHIALLSVLNRQSKSHVLFSSIEHPAVREMANELKNAVLKPRKFLLTQMELYSRRLWFPCCVQIRF